MWSTIAASTALASLMLGVAALAGRVRFGPLRGRWRLPPVELRPKDAARFGAVSSTRTPLCIEFDAGEGESLAGAGRLAAATWLRDAPGLPRGPIEARVVVATSRPRGPSRRGAYADPASPWHGVLFGLMELSGPAARRLGFEDERGEVEAEAVARLLAAALSTVAAFLYGVPLGALSPFGPAQLAGAGVSRGPLRRFGGAERAVVEIERLPVPSPARALGDGGALVRPDAVLTRAVRFALGTAPASAQVARSFAPHDLGLRVLLLPTTRPDPEGGPGQPTTTLVVTAARADAPADEAEALRDAQEAALSDLLERLAREEREDLEGN